MEIRRLKGFVAKPALGQVTVDGVIAPRKRRITVTPRQIRMARLNQALKKVADQNDFRSPEEISRAYQNSEFVEV